MYIKNKINRTPTVSSEKIEKTYRKCHFFKIFVFFVKKRQKTFKLTTCGEQQHIDFTLFGKFRQN